MYFTYDITDDATIVIALANRLLWRFDMAAESDHYTSLSVRPSNYFSMDEE